MSTNNGFFSERKIKKLFQEKTLFPSKRYGQHFLIRKEVIKKIIKISDLKKNDFILEIGPGIGNLTIELAKRVKKVLAIEKDERMIKILREVLKKFKNVKIIKGDILKIPPSQFFLPNSYKVVANLPYYLTAPFLRKFLEEVKIKPKEMVLMIQKEVAQRISAQAPKMNLLALFVQLFSQPKIISFVPKEFFWPKPKVDGAIIKVSNIRKEKPPPLFFKIVKAGFAHPRKKILNNLSEKLKLDKERVREWLLKNKIETSFRPENLEIEKWLSLAKTFPLK